MEMRTTARGVKAIILTIVIDFQVKVTMMKNSLTPRSLVSRR